mgnify:CR=1 FL=1
MLVVCMANASTGMAVGDIVQTLSQFPWALIGGGGVGGTFHWRIEDVNAVAFFAQEIDDMSGANAGTIAPKVMKETGVVPKINGQASAYVELLDIKWEPEFEFNFKLSDFQLTEFGIFYSGL